MGRMVCLLYRFYKHKPLYGNVKLHKNFLQTKIKGKSDKIFVNINKNEYKKRKSPLYKESAMIFLRVI